MAAGAGVAEAGGDDGDAGGVVELVAVEAQPAAEAITGGIVPRDAGLVDAAAGGLADDEDAGGRGGTKDGLGREREVKGAEGAGAGLDEQGVEG
jgi:hypothetical protein